MQPMKNRTDACMVAVFKEIYEYLKERNFKPKLHVMENECSKAVQTFIKEQEVPIQLVEPGDHHVNAAEIVVKTGKYHLISSLATVAKSIPLQLWFQYMPQIEITLNILRTCRRDPAISTSKALNGLFDYSKTPLVPIESPAVLILAALDGTGVKSKSVCASVSSLLPPPSIYDESVPNVTKLEDYYGDYDDDDNDDDDDNENDEEAPPFINNLTTVISKTKLQQ